MRITIDASFQVRPLIREDTERIREKIHADEGNDPGDDNGA